MASPTETAEHMFGLARSTFAHAALQAKADSDLFVLAAGLAKIATGLESMAVGLRATYAEIHDMKITQKGANMLAGLQKR